jgi:hypothetical protein
MLVLIKKKKKQKLALLQNQFKPRILIICIETTTITISCRIESSAFVTTSVTTNSSITRIVIEDTINVTEDFRHT